MKKVFIINGFPRSGKDEFVKAVKNHLQSKKIDVYNISSVDQVKKAAKLLGWNGKKDKKNRNSLSDLKDFSEISWNGPIRYMMKRLKEIDSGFIFFHIREPKQISEMVEKLPNIKTILIEREQSIKDNDNHADKNIYNYEYDFVVKNDFTLYDFIIKSSKFIEGFI